MFLGSFFWGSAISPVWEFCTPSAASWLSRCDLGILGAVGRPVAGPDLVLRPVLQLTLGTLFPVESGGTR